MLPSSSLDSTVKCSLYLPCWSRSSSLEFKPEPESLLTILSCSDSSQDSSLTLFSSISHSVDEANSHTKLAKGCTISLILVCFLFIFESLTTNLFQEFVWYRLTNRGLDGWDFKVIGETVETRWMRLCFSKPLGKFGFILKKPTMPKSWIRATVDDLGPGMSWNLVVSSKRGMTGSCSFSSWTRLSSITILDTRL